MPAGLRAVRGLARLTSWLFPPWFRREYGPGFAETAEHRWRLEVARSSSMRATLITAQILIADTAAAARANCMSAPGIPAPPHTTRARRAFATWTGGGWSDFELAVRTAARRPAFTLLVVATLGLGIGASSAGFDALDRGVLHPLGFAHPDRFVFLAVQDAERGSRFGVPAALVDRWRTGAQSVQQIEGFDVTSVAEFTRNGAVTRNALSVSGGLPAMLGFQPVVGRMLGPSDGDSAAPTAVMLAEQYWRRAYGADPSVVGRAIDLSTGPATIVGVWPAGARLDPVYAPDLILEPQRRPSSERFFSVVLARRAAGRHLEDIERELTSLAAPVPLSQCLRDMHRLGQDAGAEARLQALRRAQIDGTPEQCLEVVLKFQEREEPDRLVKLHQEIDVAARARLVARHRPEQGQPDHAEALMERRTLRLKLRKDLLPTHQPMILRGAGSFAGVPPRSSRPENERAQAIGYQVSV